MPFEKRLAVLAQPLPPRPSKTLTEALAVLICGGIATIFVRLATPVTVVPSCFATNRPSPFPAPSKPVRHFVGREGRVGMS
jgi:hypothetical protein